MRSARIDLVQGQLTALVSLRDVESNAGGIPCWIFASDGLSALSQRELCVTIRRVPGEREDDPPIEALQFFQTVFELAKEGRKVDAGGMTFLRESGFLGGAGFQGAVYVEAEAPMGDPPRLAVIALTGDELALARDLGSTRVLARLAFETHHFPYPPWIDRIRRSVVSPGEVQQSLLSRLPRLMATGATAIREAGRVVLRIPERGASALRPRVKALPHDSRIALLTDLAPFADGQLTWQPGQTEPLAVAPKGSRGERLAGSFLALVPVEPTDEVRLVEDGFAASLTLATARAVRLALERGESIDLPARGPDGLGFEIRVGV